MLSSIHSQAAGKVMSTWSFWPHPEQARSLIPCCTLFYFTQMSPFQLVGKFQVGFPQSLLSTFEHHYLLGSCTAYYERLDFFKKNRFGRGTSKCQPFVSFFNLVKSTKGSAQFPLVVQEQEALSPCFSLILERAVPRRENNLHMRCYYAQEKESRKTQQLWGSMCSAI